MRDELRAVCDDTRCRRRRPRSASAPSHGREARAQGRASRTRCRDDDPRRVSPAGRGHAVAVRSSATAEDTADTSFAGMNETFTNVEGDDALLERDRRLLGVAVRRPRRVVPRVARHHRRAGDRRGRAADGRRRALGRDVHRRPGDRRPRSRRDRGRVRARRGRRRRAGRARHVRGRQGRPAICSTCASGTRRIAIVRGADGDERRRARSPTRRRTAGCSPTTRCSTLARLGARVEEHYGEPQDIEWAIDGGDVFLVQSRPITTLGRRAATPRAASADAGRGLGASPGHRRAGGSASLRTPTKATRSRAGEVLVAPMTTPDWVPVMRRAGGARDRRRRHDLPRRDRQPRARRPVRRRHARRDRRAARRRARDRRRRRGRGATRATASPS